MERAYVYYHLGKHGRICIRPGICVGLPYRASLQVYYDNNHRVTRVRTVRMPQAPGYRFFDQDRWKKNPEKRIAIARDLVGSKLLIGKSEEELTRLLGRPDGRRKLSDEPWELRVHCSSGAMNFDTFFYWPSKRYGRAEEGYIERIGEWAYLHE